MKTELQRLLCEEALTLNTELDIMRAAELTNRDQAMKLTEKYKPQSFNAVKQKVRNQTLDKAEYKEC